MASSKIIILTTLELSFMLLENIDAASVTHDDRHIFIVQANDFVPFLPMGTMIESLLLRVIGSTCESF